VLGYNEARSESLVGLLSLLLGMKFGKLVAFAGLTTTAIPADAIVK
jgi:hypothetical protein